MNAQASSKAVHSPYFKKIKRCSPRHAENGPSSGDDSDTRSDTITSGYFQASPSNALAWQRTGTHCPTDTSEPDAFLVESFPLTSEIAIEEPHRSLLRNAAFRNFYCAFLRAYEPLYRAKPILIQGENRSLARPYASYR